MSAIAPQALLSCIYISEPTGYAPLIFSFAEINAHQAAEFEVRKPEVIFQTDELHRRR
jgi:hypothetical protein